MENIVYVFGNQDLKKDSLPLRILPKLQILFPNIRFEVKDPNEEWPDSGDLIVIDTTLGIKETTVFDSLEKFVPAPRITAHDFDTLTNLRYLQKIGKIGKIKIIGIPPYAEENKILPSVANELRKLIVI